MLVNGIEETNTEIIKKSDTSVQFIAHDNTLNSWSGEVNVEVTARNDILGQGFVDKYNWQFTINKDSTPPKVISTSPQDGAGNVPIDIAQITIKFSKPMDATATENALTISPSVNYSTYWVDSKNLYLTLDHGTLDYCQEYTVTVTDAATDTSGIKLDGDGDGKAGGDYKLKFKTEKPDISFKLDPVSKLFELPGDSYLDGNIKINGVNLKKDINVNITSNITGDNDALSFNGGSGSFYLNAGEIHNILYDVQAYSEGYIDVNLRLKYKDFEKNTQGYFAAIDTSNHPEPDHPDENQSPGVTNYPTNFLIESDSIESDIKVGIFTSGLGMGFSHLLGKYNITSVLVFPDLKYWRNPDTTLSDVIDLLVIGSGALTNYNSPEFKQKLENYVSGGGNLLVLDQKRGLYYSVLPGNINGYGWSEDQSCFHNAVYLSEWHPIFSGQTRQFIDCKVDGYLNQYPNNTNILLKRTINGMPALISYPYGTGNITITSMYPDWGYGHNQVSQEELKLFRDLTTYTMNPNMSIPEFYPDSNVSVPVKIYYSDYDTILAKKAIIKIYTPDRELYDSLDIVTNLNYGEDTTFIWNHSSIPDSLGLWVIDYALLDSNDQYIQKYKRGAIFAERVDIPTGNYNLGDYQIWANSDREKVLYGDTINFHAYLKNNTDSLFHGKIIIGTHNNTSYWSVIDSITGISIPPDSVFEFDSINVAIYNNSRVYFGLYNNNVTSYDAFSYNAIASYYKGVGIEINPFSLVIKTDSNSYQIGDTVYYSTTISNTLSYPSLLNYKVYTMMGSTKYYIDTQSVMLPQNSDTIIEGSFFPSELNPEGGGDCKIGCELYKNNSELVNRAIDYYALVYPGTKIDMVLPDSFDYIGNNPYEIKIESEGGYIPNGLLICKGKDYIDSLTIPVIQSPETTITMNYKPSKWHCFDHIQAIYKYGIQTATISKDLPGFLPIMSCPLRINSTNNYVNPGDTAIFYGRIATGDTKLYNAPVTVWEKDCPKSEDMFADTVTVNPFDTIAVNVKVYIDTTLPYGKWHTYRTGTNYLDKQIAFLASPGFKIHPPIVGFGWYYKDTFQIGEPLPFTISNPIKIAAELTLDSVGITNYRNIDLYQQGPGDLTITKGNPYTFNYNIAPYLVSGNYYLKADYQIPEDEDTYNDMFKGHGCPIFIKGIESGISVNTDKEWYLHNENIPIESHVNNGDYAFTGVESLFVYPFEETTNYYSLELDPNEFYGVHFKNNNVQDTVVIDSFYSLHNTDEYMIGYENPFILSDKGSNNIWLIEDSTATLYEEEHLDSIRSIKIKGMNNISDCAIKNGWLYIADMNQRKIYRVNTLDGSIANSWHVPDTTSGYILGVACDDDNNIIVDDDLTKMLYKFDENGNLIDTLSLPNDLHYMDIDYSFGRAFLVTNSIVLEVSGTDIDTFCTMDPMFEDSYKAISVGKNGNVAVACNNNLLLYNSDGTLRSRNIGDYRYFNESVLYRNNSILICAENWGKIENNRRKNKIYSEIYRYDEFGVDKGLVKLEGLNFDNIFENYDHYDNPKAGNISYKGGDSYSDRIPLESYVGGYYIPPIYIEMSGDWHNSPEFYGIDLGVRELKKDSLIYSTTHSVSPGAGGNILLSDTIEDSIPIGDYAVQVELFTDHDQIVNYSMNHFSVIDNRVSLLINSDTNNVPEGWTFHPHIKVVNPLSVSEDSVHLVISSDDSTYMDTLFHIDSLTTDSFPIDISTNAPMSLYGNLFLPSGDTIEKSILLNVIHSKLFADITAPEYVNYNPFEVKTDVYNGDMMEHNVIVRRIIENDSMSDTVSIPPENSFIFHDTVSVIHPDTFYVNVTEGMYEIKSKVPVKLGIHCSIKMDSVYNVSPDSVEMQAIVKNEGLYPVNAKALFCLSDSEQILKRENRQIFSVARNVGKEITFGKFVDNIVRANIDTSLSYFTLNAGSEDTIPIMFDTHNPGNYVLQGFLYTDSSSIFLDSSQSNVNIIENSLISIDSIIASAYCDSSGNVPVSVIVTNNSYNSFAGDMILSSPVCYMDTVVDIPSQRTDTIIFSLQYIVDEGQYPFTAQVRDGGVSIAEKVTDLQFSPIYTFNSIPNDYYLPLGDSGIVSLSICNIGNAKGNRRISANWADVININTNMEIDPSSVDSASQVFYIPNDMPGGEYICNVSILNGYYPETDTFFKLWIEGVNITAWDSLDKPVYYSGDTARLSILIDNHNMWSGILDAAIQYGNYSKDTSFILGGMEKGISDNTSSRDTLYLDTNAIYMLDPINTEGNDSISFKWNVSNDSLKLAFRTDSVIGKGGWTDADTGVNYPISDWTQIKVENTLTSNQWMDSLSYILNAIDTTVFDTFPSQRENIEFALPVSDSVRKAAWGIYYPSGRSVVLDERYIYTMNDSLTVVTDKGRYGLLDTVNATVYKSFPGTNYNFRYHVYFSPTNIVEDSFSLSGDSAKFSFVVPDWTRSGSYSIDYQLSNNGKSHYGSKLYHNAEYKEEIPFNKVINDRQLISHKNFVDNQKKIAKEWMEGKRIIEKSDSAISEGSHPFDVTGITVYFNKVITDTNTYHIEDTAKLWINIYSDVDMNCSLILSSTGLEVDTFDLSLRKGTPNNFELKYPIIGFKRGMNEMYLNLVRDSMSIAGMIQYFDVEIPDTTAPEITIISEPENTYSSIQYEVNVRISNPDSSGTIYDTLYYRTSNIGSYWHAVTSSKTGDNTYRYIIPPQSRGTLIEYYITARDSFGNCTQYPDNGVESFWVLTPMKPLWSEPTYNKDTVVVLSWSPPSEMITYHCGIKSDTVNVKDTIVAVKFVPQYLPARLNKIGVSFADIDSTKSGTMFNIRSRALDNAKDIDTVIVYVYQVCDSLPGAQIDSFIFERSVNGYEEFNLPDIQVNENGIFIGLKCSSDKGIIFDGYGTGSHTAICSDNKWSDLTPGEAHISGFMSYIPDTGKRQSSILSFNVLRYSYNDTTWSEIGSGIKDTVFVDSSANENTRYSYKVEAKFDNPNNSFTSSPWDVFIDLTPPSLDTVLITSAIGGIVQINAILRDTSGIRWDSFGYKCNDSIFVIPPDSSTGSNYYYSMPFTEDTLNYFIVAYDSSLFCNNARYPDTGYYKWINGNFGIFRKRSIDSTYVAKLPQNPVRNGTILKYELSRKANVKIALYNIMGRKLKTLDSGLKKQGYYSVSIGNDIMQSQGVYFIKVELGNYEKTIKLVKLK